MGRGAVRTSCEVQQKGHPTPRSNSSSLRLYLRLTPRAPWRGRIKGPTPGSPLPQRLGWSLPAARSPGAAASRLASRLSGAHFPRAGQLRRRRFTVCPCPPPSPPLPHLSDPQTSHRLSCSAPRAWAERVQRRAPLWEGAPGSHAHGGRRVKTPSSRFPAPRPFFQPLVLRNKFTQVSCLSIVPQPRPRAASLLLTERTALFSEGDLNRNVSCT